MMKQVFLVMVLVMAMGVLGCTSRAVSTTPRSAIEQLLLSGAVDAALAKLELPGVAGKKVGIDTANLSTYDVEYVRAAARVRLAEMGAVLAAKAEEAEWVVEVASGGLGLEHKTSVVGLPSLPVPNAPVPTPALTPYRSIEQTGIVKLLFLVHADGKLIAIRRCYARYDRDETFLFGLRYQTHDDIRAGWEAADRDLTAPPADEKAP